MVQKCLFSFSLKGKYSWQIGTETDWTLHDNSLVSFKFKVQSKSAVTVADVGDPMTPSC